MLFYLGAHHEGWLSTVDVPLFVSRRRLARRRSLPVAKAPWALDSGGFTELSMFGRWTLDAPRYAAEVRRYATEIGKLDFAAPQDWMCEPDMLKKTGLDVPEHQARTLANFLELRSLAPELPWIPVLQGWTLADYQRHADEYQRAGVDLAALPRVGLGTVCRRQGTEIATSAIDTFARAGIKLHAFGFKARGLAASAHALASADSLAWSYSAHREPPLPGHEAQHKNCANCLAYALRWRARLLDNPAPASRPSRAPSAERRQLAFAWAA